MATKKTYSIDDILDEYSVDNKKPEPSSDISNTQSAPGAKHSIPDISDIISDEYSLEEIIGNQIPSENRQSRQDDIIDISLIQIQDEPNNPETPEIISDIVNYFEIDKSNEEREFATIKESIERAWRPSDAPSDIEEQAAASVKAEKILNMAKAKNKAALNETDKDISVPELNASKPDKSESEKKSEDTAPVNSEKITDNPKKNQDFENQDIKEISDKISKIKESVSASEKNLVLSTEENTKDSDDPDFLRFSFAHNFSDNKSPLGISADSNKTISEIHGSKPENLKAEKNDSKKEEHPEKTFSVPEDKPKVNIDDIKEKAKKETKKADTPSPKTDLKSHLKNKSAATDDTSESIISDKPSSLRFKSYRSATRIQDNPNKIVKNPEDNIRYVRKVTDKEQLSPENMHIPKKRKAEHIPETKADIQNLEIQETEKEKKQSGESLKKAIASVREKLTGSGHKTVADKKPSINLKSIPEVDYFSIDIEINEPSKDSDTKRGKKAGKLFKNINNNFTHSSENHLDDYNAPKDASLILDDLYDLKTNITIKFVLQLVVLIISLYFSAASIYNIPMFKALRPSEAPNTYGFIMFILSAVVLFTSFPVITGGLRNIFRRKADCDSLAAVLMTFSTIAAAITIENPDMLKNNSVNIFTPVAIAAFLANTFGKQLIVNRAINNFDMLISSNDKYALRYIDNETRAEQLTKGVINDYPILATTYKTGFASDFLKYTYSADNADKLCRKAIPFALIFSVITTVVSVFWYQKTMDTVSFTFIFSVFSLCLCAFACLGIPIVVNLPLASAAAEVEDNESIILGYQSIDDFYDTNSVIINASQIFPEHSIKLSAIKMFSDTKIDDAIIAAASIVKSSGSIFTGMFNKIIDNDDSLIEHIENYSYEESMGICGWIRNKRILFGNRQLMINHNIEGMPPKSKEKDLIGKGKTAIYLSISGNLAAMFIIKIKADKEVTENLNDLVNNGISLIVKSIDPVTTVMRISRLFDIPEDMIKIIPAEYHKFCEKQMEPVAKTSASVICSGTLSSVSKAISNTKYIHNSTLTGLVLQSTSAIISIFIILAFLFLGVLNQITPLLLVFYHTIWLLITLLVMKIKPR